MGVNQDQDGERGMYRVKLLWGERKRWGVNRGIGREKKGGGVQRGWGDRKRKGSMKGMERGKGRGSIRDLEVLGVGRGGRVEGGKEGEGGRARTRLEKFWKSNIT